MLIIKGNHGMTGRYRLGSHMLAGTMPKQRHRHSHIVRNIAPAHCDDGSVGFGPRLDMGPYHQGRIWITRRQNS